MTNPTFEFEGDENKFVESTPNDTSHSCLQRRRAMLSPPPCYQPRRKIHRIETGVSQANPSIFLPSFDSDCQHNQSLDSNEEIPQVLLRPRLSIQILPEIPVLQDQTNRNDKRIRGSRPPPLTPSSSSTSEEYSSLSPRKASIMHARCA